MNKIYQLAIACSVTMLLVPTAYVSAQDGGITALEEIVVTGRKREESLQDVPISISVLDAALISDAGIVDQRDLFELVPGIHYDQIFDRNAPQASVRGVQSHEPATNRTKVTSFLDGMPIIGSAGSIAIGGAAQVEVYRGPQSASFGRSTFGGAINYISRDPGEELEGSVSVDFNDYSRQIFTGYIGGPVNDRIGFFVSASTEDSSAPSEYTTNEGIENDSRSGDSITGKLVFNPSDALEIEVALTHVETADAPTANYFITQEARDACFDGTVSIGRSIAPYGTGVIDCDWSQGPQPISQYDRVPALVAAGVTDENILFLAEMLSVTPDQIGGFDERDRATLQFDYSLDNGQLIQFSGFVGDENYVRRNDTHYNTAAINIAERAPGSGVYRLTDRGPAATVGGIRPDPTTMEESYAEIRWVSASDQRLRWLGGLSQYQSEFLTTIHRPGYGALQRGPEAVERYNTLLGLSGVGIFSAGAPAALLGEDTHNLGVFVNLTYDLTEALTVTAEARFQIDTVSGTDRATGFRLERETKAILPRLSFNYNASGDTSFYGQIALGNNPAGVNSTFLNQNYIDVLNNGVPDGMGVMNGVAAGGACDGSATAQGLEACRSIYVSYTAEDVAIFEEEELLNIEFGMKGTALDGRLVYSASIYKLFWDNEAQTDFLDWSNPANDDPYNFTRVRMAFNNGDIETQGAEFEGNFLLTDNWSLRAAAAYLDAEYVDYCDIAASGNAGLATDPTKFETHPTYGSECYVTTGNTVRQQPSVSGSLSPSFTTELNNSMSLNVRGDIRYEGQQYLDVYNTGEQAAVTMVNLSARVRADNWNLTLYANNLFEEDTPTRLRGGVDRSIVGDTLGLGRNAQANYLVVPRAPRTIGLRASYNF